MAEINVQYGSTMYWEDVRIFATDCQVLVDNSNENLYASVRLLGQDFKIYNSAVYYIPENHEIYVCDVNYNQVGSILKGGISNLNGVWKETWNLVDYGNGTSCPTFINIDTLIYNIHRTDISPAGVKSSNIPVFTNGTDYMNYILNPLTTYTWQSVPSISGKNGILSLVTLDSESINDGEPVSGAAVSVFDQAPSNDNNIKNLADTYGGGEASSAVDVTVKYKVTLPPGGSFSVLKLVAKKDSIPEDVSDGDKIVDISPSKTKKTVTGLDENSLYYFKIFAEDTNSNTSESDEKHIMTSGDEGWTFDYTGSIQTFVAPKTGIYQLETWGAQGGDATDGTLTARGGYGAYAVGEVLLQQGDTLYINVGGQNGYGGGGNPTNIIPIEASVLSNAYKSSYSNSTTPENVDTDYYDSFSDVAQYFGTDTCITTGELSKQQLSNDNGSIKFTQPNPYDIMSYTVIPLGGTYNVTNISFTYSKTINTGQIYVGANYNRLCIAIVKIVNAKIQSISWVFDERENENKSNVSIDESINAEGNYILIHEAAGTVLINDLVLTVR